MKIHTVVYVSGCTLLELAAQAGGLIIHKVVGTENTWPILLWMCLLIQLIFSINNTFLIENPGLESQLQREVKL
jgi:hypothetical protein